MGEAPAASGGTSNPPLTVVIPALNAGSTIEEQLRALDRQVDAPYFSVIVVDNGSSDSTAEIAMSFPASAYKIEVVSEAVRGINRARNAGIARAAGGFILLCDADDVVDHRWVAEFAAAIEADVWLAGSLDYEALNSERTRQIWGRATRSEFRVTLPYADNTYGGNCGFWTAMWTQVGGFDSSLSGSGDENEFFMRAHDAGFRVKSAPAAVVAYRLRPGLRAVCRQRYRQGESQVRVRSTAGGRLLPPAPSIAESARSLARLVLASPRYLIRRSTRSHWMATCALHLGRIRGQVESRDQTS